MVIQVIPPGGTVAGKDRNHFIKKYWQALCPVPRGSNPAWENTGGKDGPFNANVGAELYMLSFSRNPQSQVTRNIHVPNNKGLFIPIMSVIVSECEKPNETTDKLIAIANKDQAGIASNSLSLELDGTPLPINTLNNYKSNPATIGTFSVNFPPPPQAIFPIDSPGPCNAVAGGRYVWTDALSPGEHTVSFKGNLQCAPPTDCIDSNYMEDIIYKITVP
jgi:hypothetical protein